MTDGHQGFAGGDLGDLSTRVLACWDAFIAIAEQADPATPTRLNGWTAREVCLHLGRWPDSRPVESLLTSARNGAPGAPHKADDLNAQLLAAHEDATYDDVLAALRASRTAIAGVLTDPDIKELGTKPAMSVLGPLPVLTVIHAGIYELAVHALDLGAHDDLLTLSGLAAIADTTGGLAARQGMDVAVSVSTPTGGWSMQAHDGGWEVTAVVQGTVPKGVTIIGSGEDLLDVSAGRANGPALLAQRKLKVQDLRGFMALAPILDVVPGLPGGAPLKAAARVVGATFGLAGRLPGFRRR